MQKNARVALLVAVGVLTLGAAAFLLWPRESVAHGPLEVSPNPIDFGSVPWLDQVEKQVTIRNRSKSSIVLRDPTFDCQCFRLMRPPTNVRLTPGASTEVTIVFFTMKGEPGPIKKTFTIRSDVGQVDVPVIGKISDFRSVTPRDLFLGDLQAGGEPVEKSVQVRGGYGYAVRVVEAVTNDPGLDVTTRPASGGTDVVVRTKPDVKRGMLAGQVRLTLEVKAPDGTVRKYADTVLVRATIY